MKKILLPLLSSLTIALLTVSTVAQAGIYAGAGFGYGRAKLEQSAVGVDLNKGDYAGGIFAGYLWSTGKFDYGAVLEANMLDKSTYTRTSERYTVRSSNVGLYGTVQIFPCRGKSNAAGFYISGKIGPVLVHQKTTRDVLDSSDPLINSFKDIGESRDVIKLGAGAGVGYVFSQHWQLGVDYTHVFGSDPNPPLASAPPTVQASKEDFNKIASTDTVLVQLAYRF